MLLVHFKYTWVSILKNVLFFSEGCYVISGQVDSFTFFSAFAALLSVGRIIVHGIGSVHDNVSRLMPCNNNKTIDFIMINQK